MNTVVRRSAATMVTGAAIGALIGIAAVAPASAGIAGSWRGSGAAAACEKARHNVQRDYTDRVYYCDTTSDSATLIYKDRQRSDRSGGCYSPSRPGTGSASS